jgi:hypothetical protein
MTVSFNDEELSATYSMKQVMATGNLWITWLELCNVVYSIQLPANGFLQSDKNSGRMEEQVVVTSG